MTNAIRVSIQPIGDAALPDIGMTGVDGGIPLIAWRGDGAHDRVDLLLGNVTDPADYLRRLARMLAAFAADVDEALRTTEPTGYDAPVGLQVSPDAAGSGVGS